MLYIPNWFLCNFFGSRRTLVFISSDFNTTSFNWWMETTDKVGQAQPESGNATGFNRWLFT